MLTKTISTLTDVPKLNTHAKLIEVPSNETEVNKFESLLFVVIIYILLN